MRSSVRPALRMHRAPRARPAILLAIAGAAMPSPLAAQGAQVIPPTREEVTRPESPQPVSRAPRLDVDGPVKRSPCALDAPEFAAIRFTLRDVEFDGIEEPRKRDLAPSYAPLIGRALGISVVCEIRDRAEAILRDAGYIAAVEVPEQRIADGVLRFRVLMARMTEVRVRGDASGAERIIAGYLRALSSRPVFNRKEAERYLLLASDLPGYDVRLTLRPAGSAPGEVIGDVTVERSSGYADANVQNGGSHLVGRWGGLVRGQLFGLTGLGDRTSVGAFATSDLEEQKTVQIGHDFRIGARGLGASANVTYAWARPSVGGLDVRARTLLATAEIGYPIVRSLTGTLRGWVGMDFVDQEVELAGATFSRDRLRVAHARLVTTLIGDGVSPGRSFAEPKWRLTSSIEARKGLGIFGATDGCAAAAAGCVADDAVARSRADGRSAAALVRGQAAAEFRPKPKVTYALALRGQYAARPLLSFEEFSAGNYTVGRGFDPGALVGDSGIGVQGEVRLGSTIPTGPQRLAIEGYGFVDHARVGNRGELDPIAGPNRLSSVGGGARLAWNRFLLDVAVAAPLTRIGAPGDKPGPRLLISLTSRLWPWSLQ